jgi:hypothetical protein
LFSGLVQAPAGVVPGIAEVTFDLDSPHANVAQPLTVELPVTDP